MPCICAVNYLSLINRVALGLPTNFKLNDVPYKVLSNYYNVDYSYISMLYNVYRYMPSSIINTITPSLLADALVSFNQDIDLIIARHGHYPYTAKLFAKLLINMSGV